MSTKGDTSSSRCLNCSKCSNCLKMDFWCKPPSPEVDTIFWCLYVFCIICFVGGNVANAVKLKDYASGDHWYYFGILLLTMIVPQVLINPLWYWLSKDDYAGRDPPQNMSCQKKVLYLLLGWWTVTCDFGIDAWISCRKKDSKHYRAVFKRQAGIVRFRLLYTIISAGPQLVLQVYRLLNEEWGGSSKGLDVFFCIITLGSIAVSITTLSMSSKRARCNNTDVCRAGAVMRILSHSCFLSCRVMALVCLFSIDKIAGFVNYVVLFVLYLIIIANSENSLDKEKTKGIFYFFYCIAMALVRLFWYTDIEDTKSAKIRYTIFFGETFLFAVCFVLGYSCYVQSFWKIIFILPFFFGLLFHFLNRGLFHPISGCLYQPRELLDWELNLPRVEKGRKKRNLPL